METFLIDIIVENYRTGITINFEENTNFNLVVNIYGVIEVHVIGLTNNLIKEKV